MPQYMLLIYGPTDGVPPGQQAEMTRWEEYTQSLEDARVLVGGAQLHGLEAATTLRVRDSETLVSDGPFAVTKEFLAGYYLLECPDLDAALEHAAGVPHLHYGVGRGAPARRAGRAGTARGARRGVRTRGERRPGAGDPAAAVERAFREERAGVLATLIRHVGDVQLAEDAVQDAFAAAIATWPRDGVPANPGAWITTAARRRAIDRLRRGRSLADRVDRLAQLARLDSQEHPSSVDQSAIEDDRLRLIFTCCHPALTLPARTALTLRLLGGLTTSEIARAFVVSEPTMGQRISRAKSKIADAHTSPTGCLPTLFCPTAWWVCAA